LDNRKPGVAKGVVCENGSARAERQCLESCSK